MQACIGTLSTITVLSCPCEAVLCSLTLGNAAQGKARLGIAYATAVGIPLIWDGYDQALFTGDVIRITSVQ